MLPRVRSPFGISRQCLRNLSSSVAHSSDQTQSQAPPVLVKIRSDLKTAMRAKDTTRLNVLRGILAEITNSSKTSNPVSTDIQVLGILRKRAEASRSAARELEANGRQEMKEKEEEQVGVLEEYASTVQTIGEDEIRERVGEVVNELAMGGKEDKAKKGQVMKRLLGPGGVFEGRSVEKKDVVNMVDLALGTS